uniref:Uncharacterized protein n=1 Tax=Glossina pallidipes TaxID=7398 RepID=A0A1A9ZFP0_GLOPL
MTAINSAANAKFKSYYLLNNSNSNRNSNNNKKNILTAKTYMHYRKHHRPVACTYRVAKRSNAGHNSKQYGQTRHRTARRGTAQHSTSTLVLVLATATQVAWFSQFMAKKRKILHAPVFMSLTKRFNK